MKLCDDVSSKTAQNVVAPKTSVQDELKATLARRRSGINGPDSLYSGRVFKPPVIKQEPEHRVKLMGQDEATSKNQSQAIVDEEHDWSDEE